MTISREEKTVNVNGLPGELVDPQRMKTIYFGKGIAAIGWSYTPYIAIHRFIYRGSSELRSPIRAKVVAGRTGGPAGTLDLKIYDFTNATEIVEKTGIGDLGVNPIDLGTLTNIPTGEAIIELQAKVSAIGVICQVDDYEWYMTI